MSITLTIDGREVTVLAGTTIWDAARSLEIEIPTLCHDPGLAPVGVCRMCVVEVEGARTLVASCVREVESEMVVRSTNERVERSRGVLTSIAVAIHTTARPKHAKQMLRMSGLSVRVHSTRQMTAVTTRIATGTNGFSNSR